MNENDYNSETDIETTVVVDDENVNKTQTKKGGRFKKMCALVLCGLIFGATAAAGFAGANALLKTTQKTAQTTETAEAETRQTTSVSLQQVSYSAGDASLSQSLDVSDIAEGMMPAMVSITNISVQEVESYFGMFGSSRTQTQQSQSSGTGIIIGENDSELLIVTNNHVVEDATTLSVCFVDNEVCEATIKGTDPDNDLAVIAVKLTDIKESTANAIKVAKIGDSDALKVGRQVVAIGNALGYGQSVTTGIVSALGRQIDTTDAIMIQTDAAINPGNSGGALLNMNGEVIGINSAKFSSTEVEGMGYAISITTATPIIEDLMNRTTREKVADENASWIGIKGEDITASISAAYGIPQGIYITSIDNDSPLKEAGVTVKCVITHFDGISVTGSSNLENRLKYYAAGEKVEVTVQVIEGNEYVEKTFEITLGKASEHTSSGSRSGSGYSGRSGMP
ncbi:MAG: trypsin-like peptidase domain-containing protein [Clostridia bacterium]|nr:trypsin-like peptidase domain-containing protein [Clostridia bacterium]